ncbi:MAG: hypothetical protein AAF449_15810, partial [Myxococcota bacterium]
MLLGAKSMTALVLLAVSTSAAHWLGRLRPDYLAQLSVWAGFAIGAFAILAAETIFHFARLGQPSEHRLRIGRGALSVERIDPFARAPELNSIRRQTLRRLLMRAIYGTTFLFIGLITIDNRGVALLSSVEEAFAPPNHSFCLEADEPPPDDPQLAGCELLRRAYALGYAKELGPCAPKAVEAAVPICDRRQLDEPYLHYAWRLLSDRYPDLLPNAAQGVQTALRNIEANWDHLSDLFFNQHDPIARTPRASHHLFTNLPSPRSTPLQKVVDTLDVASCDQRSVQMPPLVVTDGRPHPPSLALEHALGQLLFNPSYPTVIASCREYTIHWNAPADACQSLVDRPKAFLEAQGALDDVRTVIDRHRRATLLLAKPPQLSRIISFQCLIVAPSKETATRPITNKGTYVDGYRFSVRSIRALPFRAEVRDQVQLFRQLGRLLAPGFAYGRLQSEQSLVEPDAEAAAAVQFAETTDLLTKLELMHEADIFLGHTWLDDRP